MAKRSVLLLATLLATGIGVVLGLLGGGGSVLTLPMLVYVVGVAPKDAIASSLFVVATTSAVALAVNARRSCVAWREGLVFGGAAMTGAYAGGRAAGLVPASILLFLFATMMVVASMGMLRRRVGRTEGPRRTPLMLPLGAAVGFLSGLVGAGGGFMIVPALVLVAGLPMRRAIGTSLLVITMQSSAGFLGHLSHVTLDPVLVAAVTAASVAGASVGAVLSHQVAPEKLRGAFASLMAIMGVVMLGKQVPLAGVAAALALATPVVVVVARRARPALAR